MCMNEHRYANAGKIRGAGTRQALRIDECCYIPTGYFHSKENIEHEENRRVGNWDLRILIESMEILCFSQEIFSKTM